MPADRPPVLLPPDLPRPGRDTDAKAVEELKAKLAKLTAEAEQKAAEAKKAEVEAKAAEDELAKIREAAKLGRIKAGTIEAAVEKVAEAQVRAAKLAQQRVELDVEIALLRSRLKGIEK